MEIEFCNKIRKKIELPTMVYRNFDKKISVNIIATISILQQADNLGQIPNCPPTRRHKLLGNLGWAIDLSKNYRMIIKPPDEMINQSPENIKKITIMDICDYH